MDKVANIIGAGLSGLSCAISLAEHNIHVNLVSRQDSYRSQSTLAEGGINAVLDTMGDGDTIEDHYDDTMKGGVYLANPKAVRNLTQNAPSVIEYLHSIGMPFNMESGRIVQRYFGGQKKRRTAYAKSSTGRILVNTLADECRKYEKMGLVRRFSAHCFLGLVFPEGKKDTCLGAWIADEYAPSHSPILLRGPVIIACGGLNGLFPGFTTGTTQNNAFVQAILFSCGVRFSNLEMIQYHPTTFGISGKRCLISEAARGEGGRLYVEKDKKPYYFMEEKYPELKNLMPRDVVSREMYFISHEENESPIYLDMRGLSKKTWKEKLPDLRDEIMDYLSIDPKKTPVKVSPGIHYFMGGIDTDEMHRTNIKNLYASGEATSLYHGANRLGGNSTMGAIYGGKRAAQTIMENDAWDDFSRDSDKEIKPLSYGTDDPEISARSGEILRKCLDIVRDESSLQEGLNQMELLQEKACKNMDKKKLTLGKAMIKSAILRKESRGAHYRIDYPKTREEYRKKTVSEYRDEEINISLQEID